MLQLNPSTKLRQQRTEARARHIQTLLDLGWLEEGGRWRSPHGMRLCYDTAGAVLIEKLRGGIKGNGKCWKIT